jgi:thiamine biosynthesis lipoprotein
MGRHTMGRHSTLIHALATVLVLATLLYGTGLAASDDVSRTPVAEAKERADRQPLTKRTRFMMGTYVTVIVAGPEDAAREAAEAALNRMEEVDDKFRIQNPESPLYSFNEEGVPVTDQEILKVVRAALELSRKTDGAFDITVAPLVELWGFFTDSPRLPSPEEVRESLALVGYQRVAITDGELRKLVEGTRIDLGGIAKGYAVGEGAGVLREHGITSALIDAGGDIYALGRRGDDPWKVGIRSPRGEDLLGYIEVEDVAVMGSGDYERFFIEDGVRYHHIIDPTTGYPATGVTGVTVVCPDPMMADAWATALFVLGPDRGLEIAESEPDLETIMVKTDGELVVSSGFGTELRPMPGSE